MTEQESAPGCASIKKYMIEQRLLSKKMSRSGIYSQMGKCLKNESVKNVAALLAVLTASVLLFTACAERRKHGLQTPEGVLQDKTLEDSAEDATGDMIDEQTNSDDINGAHPEESPSKTWDSENTALDIINEMSIDEKIGQLFIVGFQGTTPSNVLKELIKEKHIGGVILFKRNISDPVKLHGLINSVKGLNSSGNKVPLFISVDEEGGRISRMPEKINKLPAAKLIGEINDENISYENGCLLALLTKAFGFNMNFAPVLDIWSNPENKVIGDRAYGTVPEVVSKNGIKVMEGIRDGGVIPVVKHFPGHGDTIVDSHVGLPTVDYDMERLESFELVPFQSAIDSGADAVMIAHILMKNIDPENPATLSKILITDILRGQMGFDGVVITDDMTMGAIDKNYNIGDAVVKAVLAGSDILLVCHGYEKQMEAINAVSAAVSDGRISEERLNESVCRILMLKDKYRLSDRPAAAVDIEAINKKIDALLTK